MNAKGRAQGPAPAQTSITAKQEVPSATVPLSADEARALTEEVRKDAERLWDKLLRLHDGQAWAALGYDTWDSYVAAEFDFSRRRANQLISHARIVAELDGWEQVVPTHESQSRELAKIPPGKRGEVWRKAIEATRGQPTAAAIKAVGVKVTRSEPAAGEPGPVPVDRDKLAADRKAIAAQQPTGQPKVRWDRQPFEGSLSEAFDDAMSPFRTDRLAKALRVIRVDRHGQPDPNAWTLIVPAASRLAAATVADELGEAADEYRTLAELIRRTLRAESIKRTLVAKEPAEKRGHLSLSL